MRAATTAVEPPVPAMLDVADFFFAIPVRRWSRRAGRPTMMPMSGSAWWGGGGRAQRGTGSSTTMAEFCSTVTGRVASLAPGIGSADQRNLAALTTLASLRAREARRHDSGRAAGAGDARRRRFLFRDSGSTMDGRRATDDDADVGFGLVGAAAVERSELRGHRQRWPNSAALSLVG